MSKRLGGRFGRAISAVSAVAVGGVTAVGGLVALAPSAGAATLTSVNPTNLSNEATGTLTVSPLVPLPVYTKAMTLTLTRNALTDGYVDSHTFPAAASQTDLSPTFTAQLSPQQLAPGKYDVSVSNTPADTCTQCFTLVASTVSLSGMTPSALGRGAQAVPFTLTGDHFAWGDTITATGGTGGAPAFTATAVTSTSLSGTVTVPANAEVKSWTVSVKHADGAGTSGTRSFAVTAAPAIATATPSSVHQGDSAQVVFAGTGIQSGATLAVQGVIVTNPAVNVAQQTITATVNTTGGSVGTHTVTVTNPDGGTSANTTAFSVGNPHPTITSITPNLVDGDTATLDIHGTGFLDSPRDPVVTFPAGSGVTATQLRANWLDATHLQIPVAVTQTAPAGPLAVTVTNDDGGTATCFGTACPAVYSYLLTGLTKPTGPVNDDTAYDVQVSGRNFAGTLSNYRIVLTRNGNGTQTPISGTVRAADSSTTSLIASLDLAAAEPGTYNVSVLNTSTDGTGACSPACTVTVNGSTPSVATVSPASLAQGTQNRTVTVTGGNFAHGATISLSSGPISVDNGTVAVTSPSTLTFTATAGAGTGGSAQSLQVTNSDGQASNVKANALTLAATPSAPTNVTKAEGDAQVTMEFGVPASDGGFPVTRYRATARPHAGGTAITATGTSSPITVTGLANGTRYDLTVAATNSPVGSTSPVYGPESAIIAATPDVVPGLPTSVSAVRGNQSATLSWIAPVSNGGTPVTSYTIQVSPAVAGMTTTPSPIPGSATSAVVNGLTNGTSYTFTVTAGNAMGAGSPSALSNAVVPATVPGAPRNVVAVGGNAMADLSWAAPLSDGADPISSYTVIVSPATAGASVSYSGTTAHVTGLTNGTPYTFTVTATNSVGTGPASVASNSVTPATVPGAPSGAQAQRGNSSALVSWSAPSADGGSPITGYTIAIASPSSGPATTSPQPIPASATSAVVTALTNGTAYTFTVKAVNAVGAGAASAATTSVTPAAVPDAPTEVTATAGNAAANVLWAAANGNGNPVTSYVVVPSPAAPSAVITYSDTTAHVAGLVNGTAYTFTVFATNTVGAGLSSVRSVSVTPNVEPGAPTNVVATRGDRSAALTWTAPPNQGTPVTAYTIAITPAAPGATTNPASVTGPSAVVNGLTNGTAYTFTVTAVNAKGAGPASGASNAATPAGAPGAPGAPGVTAGDGDIHAVVAGAATNGSPITGYTVTATPMGGGASVSALGAGPEIVIRGLANGVGYTVVAKARNAVGTGAASAPSAAVTPEPRSSVILSGPVSATPAGTVVTLTGHVVRPDGSVPSGALVTVFGLDTGQQLAQVRMVGSPAVQPDGSFSLTTRLVHSGTFAAGLGALDADGAYSTLSPVLSLTALARVANVHSGVSHHRLTVTGLVVPAQQAMVGGRYGRAELWQVNGKGKLVRRLGAANLNRGAARAGAPDGASAFRISGVKVTKGAVLRLVVLVTAAQDASGRSAPFTVRAR